MKRSLLIAAGLVLFLLSCQEDKPKNIEVKSRSYAVPAFLEDSAYTYIADQIAFGPRVPGSSGHAACADYLVQKLNSFGLEAGIETFTAQRHDGVVINGKNVVGKLNPEATERVFICAHWDTRYIADYDEKDKDSPILGADDGASGVGVALEIARVLAKADDFKMGLDVVLFDAEDQGENDGEINSWGIGAQKWSNKNKGSYRPKYGILLDMVGAKDARFYQEGFSLQSAPNLVYKVWKTAENLGYSDVFVKQQGRGVVDDHYFINKNAGWPVVDIIHTNQGQGTGFGAHWHTHDDDLDIIEKSVLKKVGRVVLTTLCQTDQGK